MEAGTCVIGYGDKENVKCISLKRASANAGFGKWLVLYHVGFFFMALSLK
jgi:hypothetical protein